MRELKFRIMYKKYPSSKGSRSFIKKEFTLKDLIEMDGNGFLDDDDIIEQYTGLKDKNGKEIYEGDIVLHDKIMLADTDGFFGEEKNVPCVVEWDSIRTGFYPFNHYDTEWGRYTNGIDVEVIGNIHENPELLEGDK